jgi:hypothetical protein
MKTTSHLIILLSLLLGLASCKDDDKNEPTVEVKVIKAAGDDLDAALAQYRALLGEPLNTTPGQTTGRREVNWDGVPANFTNNNNFPGNFFNAVEDNAPNGRKRGSVFSTPGSGLRISDNDFSDISSSYAGQFADFSPLRTFAAMGSTQVDVIFQVPGQTTPASVKGFGVIFSDVDEEGSTYIEFFNGNRKLGRFLAPPRQGNNSFSLLGVFFPNDKITKARIVSGNGILKDGVPDKSDGGQYDLVIMDDFLYTEPLPLP